MNAVPIDAAGEFSSGEPQTLFPTGARANNFFRQLYAVSRDGKRFLVNAPPPQSSGTQLTVVVNWTATIQK
jgi:hypothetical protein